MEKFIANKIMEQANISLENGQNKYRDYFVNTALYAKKKENVDAILKDKGYEECIVTE